WQLDVLAKLLKDAAAHYGAGQFLARLHGVPPPSPGAARVPPPSRGAEAQEPLDEQPTADGADGPGSDPNRGKTEDPSGRRPPGTEGVPSRRFGSADDAMRQRTVRLLIGAGMAQEARAFLPPLEEARAAGEARIIFAHGRYHEDLGTAGRSTAEAEEHLRRGWALLGEVAMLDSAETELRTEAMRRAIHLLPAITPAQATTWLG